MAPRLFGVDDELAVGEPRQDTVGLVGPRPTNPAAPSEAEEPRDFSQPGHALRCACGLCSGSCDVAAAEKRAGQRFCDRLANRDRCEVGDDLPGDVGEVQEIVRLAALEGVAIVPSGGRTGLSAGAVACKGELVLALDRLNDIIDFNPVDRIVRCGAGVLTQQLQDFATSQGL